MNPVNLLLRHALPEDAASLAAIEIASWQAAYRGLMPDPFLDALSYAEHADDWRRSLLKHGPQGRKRVLLAVNNATNVGFVRVGVAEATTGSVFLLYVLPALWHQGVGTRLLRAAYDELRALGMCDAFLWVLQRNERARGFYERAGWQSDGEIAQIDYGGATLDALCYRRTID